MTAFIDQDPQYSPDNRLTLYPTNLRRPSTEWFRWVSIKSGVSAPGTLLVMKKKLWPGYWTAKMKRQSLKHLLNASLNKL